MITDERVDAYIENAKPFAQPILKRIRELVHQACPEVEETIKWNFPHFNYKGMMCSMASFQEHCAFTFWKGSIMKDACNVMDKSRESSMGQFGRLTTVKDLPADKIVIDYIKEAMKLNEEGINVPKKAAPKNKELSIPESFLSALKKNKKALEAFESFSISKKKEYADWINDAKQESTRDARIATAVEWIGEGKTRNWKYE